MSHKPLSSKMFLSRANRTNKSAEGFIAAYREYLVNGEIADKTSPIVAKVDTKEVSPEIGLETIKNMVLSHLLELDRRKAQMELDKAEKEPMTSKAYIASCYNSKGELQVRINLKGEEIDMKASFDLEARALDWADRRLVLDCSSDCYATIASTKMFDEDGLPMSTIVIRKDALARMFRAKKSAFMKRLPSSSGLKWQAKVKQSHANFSRG